MVADTLQKTKWIFSWNGSSPYFLIQPLFIDPIHNLVNRFKHVKHYAIIIKDYGKEIMCRMPLEQNNKPFIEYFKKNTNTFIKTYKELIRKTNKKIEEYKDPVIKKQKLVTWREWDRLGELLVANNTLYLYTQPETSKHLKTEFLKTSKPVNTILNDLEESLNKLRKNQNAKKYQEMLLSHYWKYRSFYMIDLEANIKKELQRVQKAIKDKAFVKNKKSKDLLDTKILALSALRLEAKNTWINLTLLIINLKQQIAKQEKISNNILDRFTFAEITEFLKTGKKPVKKPGKEIILVGDKIEKIIYIDSNIKILLEEPKKMVDEQKKLIGDLVFGGNVSGTAIVITLQDNLNEKMKEMEKIKDPIIVAEQITPHYTPIIRRCKGFVTNEGGVLSHAAIVAREFQKPAVIGTKYATKMLKTGDKIFLDTKNKEVHKK
jgi:pyruvate,water dikinase